MNDGNNRVLVLADDFTGANDAGVSLAEAGMSVEVAFTAGQPSTARALILNSDSRAMSAAAAADKVAALLRGAATFVPHWQVKKIDSTLRGNPGGELEAMMAAQGCRMAVVAPAYPAAGRHTRDGRCYVHGVPLDQTEFASDPKTPVSRAEISEIIAMQSRLPCLTLNAGQLPAALATAGEEKRVLIVDAWEDSHLDQVIDAVAPHARETLLVGSAGLCEALARRLRRSEQGPLLAVVGSMSEMAQRQVAALQVHSRVRVIEIDVEQAFSGSPKEEASRIAGALREGQHCVVTTRPNHAVRQGIEARCRERGLSPRRLRGAHLRLACRRHGAGGGAVFPWRAVSFRRRCGYRRRARARRHRVSDPRPGGGVRSIRAFSRRPLVAAGDDQSRRIRHRHHAVTCCEFY